MREKELFKKSINIDITVATIGISSENWYCTNPGMKMEDIRTTMLQKNYDVVPIINKHKVFNSYFTISKPDNLKLLVNEITQDDRMYYLTHVRDAVWRMNKTKKTYFFLSNGHDENDIVGLLSLSNFNCREFYVYLFSLISYIEREFAGLIDSDKTKGFQILERMSQTEEQKGQLRSIVDRYNEGIENDYKEYLYLQQLILLIKGESNYEKLKYKNSRDFESGSAQLKNLRNNIAHPVKSIVRNLNDLNKLDSGINKLYEFKVRLDDFIITRKDK